ncbi:hypothetical protein Gohar_020534, partial [Gossypium harknessii]|nr:hypothetical protein [Gossypium harknessii]
DGVEGPLPVTSFKTVGSKCQKRPSVWLGDFGNEQHYDSHIRRSSSSSKQWKHHSSNLSLNPSLASSYLKSFKTRAFTNLTIDFNATNDTLDDHTEAQNNLDGVPIGRCRVKDFMK